MNMNDFIVHTTERRDGCIDVKGKWLKVNPGKYDRCSMYKVFIGGYILWKVVDIHHRDNYRKNSRM